MRKAFSLLFFLFWGWLPDVVLADRISVVADYWPPYNGSPQSDKPGYGIEIARTVFERAGHTVEYKLMPWTRAVNETREGVYNAIIGAYRQDAEDFIFPEEEIGVSQNVFYVKKGNEWQFQGEQSLRSVRTGLIKSYSYGEKLDTFFNDYPEYVEYVYGNHALEHSIKKLLSGRVDVVLEDRNVFEDTINRLGYTDQIREAGASDQPEAVYIAFSPALGKSREYARILSDGIRAMCKSGELTGILRRYGLKNWRQESAVACQ